ncbi:MAG: N-acetylneuraminate synthase family protein, partial [Zoogloeaceae bacterium]|nr:N-acetylneuraminate synthase family protein [Zoogloeaceae bacterium]
MTAKRIFEDLFVLELANNHWGRLERGLKIITDFSRIVRFNNVRAAIKLQFRDVDAFIHKDYRQNQDIRYIKKTMDTRLSRKDYATLVEAIRQGGCIPMATPFDERSVEQCVEQGIGIIKIASSDINDWSLIEKIAATRRPVIVSTGGSSLKSIDDLVKFFANRNIPLAINHCVSLYPSEDHELELNQIDFLKARYPENVIGFSSHEYHDWHTTVSIAYAKGARTFERHIDIEADGIPVSPYCSLPHQIDEWFKAYKKAVAVCGAPGTQKRVPPEREILYLDSLVRGVYARRDLVCGQALESDDIYFAIPLQKGQISCRELMHGEKLLRDIASDRPVMIDDI